MLSMLVIIQAPAEAAINVGGRFVSQSNVAQRVAGTHCGVSVLRKWLCLIFAFNYRDIEIG